MTRAFTHYWKNSTWRSASRDLLRYTAGNQFVEREVEPGDRLYIVTVLDGRLLLGGRIVVDRVVGPREAAHEFETTQDELWDANDFVLGKASESSSFHRDLEIPAKLARRLRFGSNEKLKWEGAERFIGRRSGA